MEQVDSTIIATALPAIAADLGTTPLKLNVAVTAYLLALAIFIPVSGWVADRFGARNVFRTAIIVFMIGSICCALSNSLPAFVASRILQGMGGAMMTPVARLIILRTVDKSELVKAMAFMSVPGLAGPMFGPPLGGLIVTIATWHWIFLVNIPIGRMSAFDDQPNHFVDWIQRQSPHIPGGAPAAESVFAPARFLLRHRSPGDRRRAMTTSQGPVPPRDHPRDMARRSGPRAADPIVHRRIRASKSPGREACGRRIRLPSLPWV